MLVFNMLLWFFLPYQDVKPQFKGGDRSLYSFISQNLIYPDYSKANCLQGKVFISFKLDNNGKVYATKIYKGTGLDLDDEALRLVRLTSGKWLPGQGQAADISYVLPIDFSLDRSGCAQMSGNEMRLAIANYKTRSDMQNVVTTFYKNKALGKADVNDEARILQFKNQLGIDDEYLADVIDDAKKKLKQGDKEGACEDFNFVKNMGSNLADELIKVNCK